MRTLPADFAFAFVCLRLAMADGRLDSDCILLLDRATVGGIAACPGELSAAVSVVPSVFVFPFGVLLFFFFFFTAASTEDDGRRSSAVVLSVPPAVDALEGFVSAPGAVGPEAMELGFILIWEKFNFLGVGRRTPFMER